MKKHVFVAVRPIIKVLEKKYNANMWHAILTLVKNAPENIFSQILLRHIV
tara:strand:+ start:872 stop:1021 length:150 start_codon:yes stop_codon:yes gene_type:complete